MSIDLAHEKDTEILRQAALLLEAENKRLVAEVMELTRRLLEAEGKERIALQLEIQALQAQLEKRNRALFGPSSEQRKGEGAAESKAPKKPKTGHGPKPQLNLRVVEEVLDLPVDDRVCILCRGALEEMDAASSPATTCAAPPRPRSSAPRRCSRTRSRRAPNTWARASSRRARARCYPRSSSSRRRPGSISARRSALEARAERPQPSSSFTTPERGESARSSCERGEKSHDDVRGLPGAVETYVLVSRTPEGETAWLPTRRTRSSPRTSPMSTRSSSMA